MTAKKKSWKNTYKKKEGGKDDSTTKEHGNKIERGEKTTVVSFIYRGTEARLLFTLLTTTHIRIHTKSLQSGGRALR